LAGLAALLCLPAGALANHDHRKVYAFVIDGLDPHAVTEGGAPFLAGLIAGSEGARTTYFPEARSMMVAETNPNHTSMVTGAVPRRTGITGNEFAVYGEADDDSCTIEKFDPTSAPTATSGENVDCVRVPNMFETIERRRNPKHITTAMIMGKPKLARLLASREVSAARYDADYIWAPCSDDEDYCTDAPTNPITGYAADDSVVMDEAIRTVENGVIDRGRRRQPDFTFVNLPQVDSAGHAAGRSSQIYDTAVTLADAQIRRFVNNQKRLGIWDRTVMMVVADHSMGDTPQLSKISIADTLTAAGVPASSFTVVGNGSAAHVYLNDRRDPAAGRLLKRMREAVSGVPGITDALYRRPNPADGKRRHTIAKQRPDWGLGGNRSGDLVVTTSSGVGVLDTSEASRFPFNPLPGNHGGPHTVRIPFLLSGGNAAIRKRRTGAPMYNNDIAPTAMGLLNRKPAKTVQGRFLREAFNLRKLGKAGKKARQGKFG
jgi:hypothetical protein